jgi:hypothetical protein
MSTIFVRRLVFAVVAGLLVVDSVNGQTSANPMGSVPYHKYFWNRNNNQPVSNGPFSVSGTIEKVAAGGIQGNIDGNSGAIIKLAPKSVVQVLGTAGPEFLKPGMLVRLNGDFDAKGKAKAPVNELEIVTEQTAVLRDDSMPGEILGDKGAKKDKPASADPSGTTLLGQLAAFKNNQMTIKSTTGVFTADLGTNPVIKVNINDLRYAQEGDKFDAKGEFTNQGAFAQKLVIKLASPLGGAKAGATKKAQKTALSK